jgi:hypothetical protein
VQWNPADDRCVFGQLRRIESTEGWLRGQLFGVNSGMAKVA